MTKQIQIAVVGMLLTSVVYGQFFHPSSFVLRSQIEETLSIGDSLPSSIRRTHFHPRVLDSLEAKTGLETSSRIYDWLFNQHFFEIRKKNLYLNIDPQYDFTIGRGIEVDNSFFYSARGVMLQGAISDRWVFSSGVVENLSRFPAYTDSSLIQERLSYGAGRLRPSGSAYDHAFSYGALTFKAFEYLSLEVGQGRQFYGNGFRSLLMSDHGYMAPYGKMRWKFSGLMYEALWTEYINFDARKADNRTHPKKRAAIKYLSLQPTRWLSVGLFEGVVFEAVDSNGRRGFDLNYVNPVLLLRPVEFNLGSPDNMLLGLDIKTQITKAFSAYGQLMIDDLNVREMLAGERGYFQQKVGLQVGIDWANAFKISPLRLRLEYNQVRPYTYASKYPNQAYTHYGLPLAHPLGANFREGLAILSYVKGRWVVTIFQSYSIQGLDATRLTHNGANIFRSDFEAGDIKSSGNTIGQGISSTRMHSELEVSYILNAKYQARFGASLLRVGETVSGASTSDWYPSIFITSSLRQFYNRF